MSVVTVVAVVPVFAVVTVSTVFSVVPVSLFSFVGPVFLGIPLSLLCARIFGRSFERTSKRILRTNFLTNYRKVFR